MKVLLVSLIGLGVVWGLTKLIMRIRDRLRVWIILRGIKRKLSEQGIRTTFSVELAQNREIRRLQYGEG